VPLWNPFLGARDSWKFFILVFPGIAKGSSRRKQECGHDHVGHLVGQESLLEWRSALSAVTAALWAALAGVGGHAITIACLHSAQPVSGKQLLVIMAAAATCFIALCLR